MVGLGQEGHFKPSLPCFLKFGCGEVAEDFLATTAEVLSGMKLAIPIRHMAQVASLSCTLTRPSCLSLLVAVLAMAVQSSQDLPSRLYALSKLNFVNSYPRDLSASLYGLCGQTSPELCAALQSLLPWQPVLAL